MTLSAHFTRHHTAWIHCGDAAPRAVRYAIDGDRLVWFGDDLGAEAVDGRRAVVTVHEIAGGPPLDQLTGSLHDVTADEIDANAVLDLLEHVSLGRTNAEVGASIARHRARRFVTITA